MSKKTKNILLLATVLGIWGIVGFRFFSMIGNDEELIGEFENTGQSEKLTFEKKTYNVLCNYPDPFLKGSTHVVIRNKTASDQKHDVKKPTTRVSPPTATFPAIQLAGVISNKDSRKQRAIVLISGQEYSVTTGESVSGFKIKRIFSDSVLVSWENKNKIIKL